MSAGLGIHDPALFVATVFVLNATPGVDMLLTVGRTLQHGRRGGGRRHHGRLRGACAGRHPRAGRPAGQLGRGLRRAEAGRRGLPRLARPRAAARGLAGAPAVAGSPASTGAVAATPGRLFREGLLTNLLNPKIALFFLALLPQFIADGASQRTLAFALLGAWMLLQSALFLAVLVLLAERLRRRPLQPGLRRGLTALAGAAFLGLAARLALSPRP
ncbi:LysE family translocator [Piscinibacter sakaiensis]